MKEILNSPDSLLKDVSTVIIESDNCSNQYKSAQHFHDLQPALQHHQKINHPSVWCCGSQKEWGWSYGRPCKSCCSKTENKWLQVLYSCQLVNGRIPRLKVSEQNQPKLLHQRDSLISSGWKKGYRLSHSSSYNWWVFKFLSDIFPSRFNWISRLLKDYAFVCSAKSLVVLVICFLLIKLDHISQVKFIWDHN